MTEPEPIPAELFKDPSLRAVLEQRDIARVFIYLSHRGISQRRIAALTGQSQSEISEIIAGRKVTSVEVLERIADGLRVPRGWLGVAYEGSGQPTAANVVTVDSAETAMLVRAFLAGVAMARYLV